jgi:hypothetical protein
MAAPAAAAAAAAAIRLGCARSQAAAVLPEAGSALGPPSAGLLLPAAAQELEKIRVSRHHEASHMSKACMVGCQALFEMMMSVNNDAASKYDMACLHLLQMLLLLLLRWRRSWWRHDRAVHHARPLDRRRQRNELRARRRLGRCFLHPHGGRCLACC